MSSDGFVLGWSVERVSLSVFIVEILDFTSHFFYILFSLFVTMRQECIIGGYNIGLLP